ncbi:TIGR03943 family protein [Leptolyngbya sp. BL0902]|uniref:TIGR03943 family putative permease subunit n=1 Tax=Leptolyngbya sp. BL0902 TaxID=1115757 RepID=UPI0018E6FEF2|nr:TIGR03943 family protein [Leptolyngbya sp. BL0902]QQE65688.1 TIGR03943 family protein [Leptolyngbya sp. BL0902]
MTSSIRSRRRPLPSPRRVSLPWQAIIDGLMLLLWAAMLLRFTVTGQIYLLLHPDYMWLSHMAMVLTFGMGMGRMWQVWQVVRLQQRQGGPRSQEHIALLPRRVSTGLLLAVAVFGLIYTPRPFTSETALQRGITEVLSQTRSRPQRFVLSGASEDRTIVDWIRTLNVYPEPEAYAGQAVNVSGFVTHMPGWPDNLFMITRFVLTCCAADAYPVGLPVELPPGTPRPAPDTWLEVTGRMTTQTLDNKRQLVIGEAALTEIPQPRTPYEY